ncbi:hypothetical protein SC377_00500 [Actinotignum sp. SLA_B059]|uniref:hypothetical protein n=1 Tax=Actinotignum sp. SLA_B059 TaxID=3083287 RepID=UPI002A833DC0|nr:hypothetical protein [Actinotignum sp. SLA_B059]MDY5126625.1 hypothetical protein [Actinotignum sp. SLA_B059]
MRKAHDSVTPVSETHVSEAPVSEARTSERGGAVVDFCLVAGLVTLAALALAVLGARVFAIEQIRDCAGRAARAGVVGQLSLPEIAGQATADITARLPACRCTASARVVHIGGEEFLRVEITGTYSSLLGTSRVRLHAHAHVLTTAGQLRQPSP